MTIQKLLQSATVFCQKETVVFEESFLSDSVGALDHPTDRASSIVLPLSAQGLVESWSGYSAGRIWGCPISFAEDLHDHQGFVFSPGGRVVEMLWKKHRR